jgi:hypothetical protein
MSDIFFWTSQELRALNYMLTRNLVRINWQVREDLANPLIYHGLFNDTLKFYFEDIKTPNYNAESIGLIIKLLVKLAIKVHHNENIRLENIPDRVYQDKGRYIYLYSQLNDDDLMAKINTYKHCATLKLMIDFETHNIVSPHVVLWFTLIEYAQRVTRGGFQGIV